MIQIKNLNKSFQLYNQNDTNINVFKNIYFSPIYIKTLCKYISFFCKNFENGVYNCNGCKTPLFNSDQKFETNCGWPSFDEAIEGTIKYVEDYSHNMIRTEIVCVKCDGHLGHVFNDGPTETGLRYCVNSVSIDFKKDPNKK